LSARTWVTLLLMAATQAAVAQAPVQDDAAYDSTAHDSAGHDSTAHDSTAHDSTAHDSAAQDLAPVRVTAPRLRMEDVYRSKPPPRTAPTVFDKAWREPVNLRKIGDEGGVVPILVRYASRQVTRAARSLPGWKGPDQPARARPAPLDDAQMQRATELQASPRP
jgi:hypothetical protein